MADLKAVLFDVDGVLLDSLAPHLKICEDLNREYGIGLRIPEAAEFRNMVRGGMKISPMEHFFSAVGFPERLARRANRRYQEIFMQCYAPAPFPGTREMLQALHGLCLQLGVVTSNVAANVVAALGPSMDFFQAECIFSKDNMGASKREAVIAAMSVLSSGPAETLYVGDQPADRQAALEAGVSFLGVSYGWGISKEDVGFPIVGDVTEIYPYIVSNWTVPRPVPTLDGLPRRT